MSARTIARNEIVSVGPAVTRSYQSMVIGMKIHSLTWGLKSRGRRTAAVTGPPPKDFDFKTREIGGSGSPLCYPTADGSAGNLRINK
jgi:hypothetical protein